eukprot:m.341570 g.341570  ORF g.341570 m.341570 type:complete len:365 (+) comp20208_c0_seq1:215-1309(+)
MSQLLRSAVSYANTLGIKLPILLSPMAGACPPSLSVAVVQAGGLGACGCNDMSPEAIHKWSHEFRSVFPEHSASVSLGNNFQMNIWVPDDTSSYVRDSSSDAMAEYLERKYDSIVEDVSPKYSYEDQLEAMLSARPRAVSTIMGLLPAQYVDKLKHEGISWFACATTVQEAVLAADAGADAIVVQGVEAGGHRGTYDPKDGDQVHIGLMSLIPSVVDNVQVPVIAAGGIADARGITAALSLGASAVQMGTVFLCAKESGVPSSWSERIATSYPESTTITRRFTGRAARALKTEFVTNKETPIEIPPYPEQARLTRNITKKGVRENNIDIMKAWSGQSGGLVGKTGESAQGMIRRIWQDTENLVS